MGAIWTRWPGAMITLSFVPCCPGYQLAKTTTNSTIENLFKIILTHAFVMHQGVKLIFQQVPFITFRITDHNLGEARQSFQRIHQKGVTFRLMGFLHISAACCLACVTHAVGP
jgi:uncharacterized membrane protein YjdF